MPDPWLLIVLAALLAAFVFVFLRMVRLDHQRDDLRERVKALESRVGNLKHSAGATEATPPAADAYAAAEAEIRSDR